MAVGKITFTSTNANSRLQQKQQNKNIAFTGILKPNISKSLLNGTSQVGEKGVGIQENNLYRKVVKYMKNLFKREKQAITGGETKVPEVIETPKPLELGVPHKVTWTDFDSVEGELIGLEKVVKNKDGKVVKEFTTYDGKTVCALFEFNPETGMAVKCTGFNKDKTVRDVTDYDPKTGEVVRQTIFNKDGNIFRVKNY